MRQALNVMALITQPRTGRQLMVLDDAETIARQARRRAALRRRRQEALQVAVGVFVFAGIVALILGASVQAVVLVEAVIFGVAAAAWHHLQEWHDERRRQQSRAHVGRGIGTPRPKGGFSTTRHRSGAPVWVDDPAA